MKVKIRSGATDTSLRTSVAIRPDSSARPTPIMATRITPTPVKPRKFATGDVTMNRIPSGDRRLRTDACCVTISPRRSS
jgi:hypothetical protein